MKKNLFPTPQATAPCSFISNVYGKAHPQQIAWEALAALIATDPILQAKTLTARQILSTGDEKGFAAAKASCGAFIPAAQFDGGRRQEHATLLTGVSMVDFDHVPQQRLAEVMDLLRRDPHTFLSYITTSGHGIRVLFPYRSQQSQIAYVDAWRWGNQYYSMLAGLDYDPATKDLTRLSFLCHDAACYYNPQAVPFDILTSEEAQEQIAQLSPCPQGSEAEALAKQIADRHIPFAEGSRHANLRYRAFLLNKMGFPQDDIARALEPDAPRGASEARGLAQWVADKGKADFGGWKGPHPQDHRGSRLTMAQQYALAVPTATTDEDVPAPPEKKSQQKFATPEEIKEYLASHQQLRYNVITAMVEMLSPEQRTFVPLNDRTLNVIWHHCTIALGKYVRMQDFLAEVNSEFVPAFNPFEDFFASLPAWDGTDHIGALAARVQVKDGETRIPLSIENPLGPAEPIFTYCFRKWFVAMVASWLDPRVMNETILTFIGSQGIYKSTFFRRLLPPELDGYFLAKGNSSYVSKDDKLAVSNRALIDFEEIDSMKDADLNTVKALLTTEVIDERSPYARTRERHPHIASFCATGNHRQFLTDLTGNRRWLPFEVERIVSPHDEPINYPQLYAQALALVEGGFRHWFSRDENAMLEEHKNGFAVDCPEEEMIRRHYRHPEPWESGLFLTATEILAHCNADLRLPLRPTRIGQALARMGFAPRFRHGRKGYILVQRDYTEIQQEKLTLAKER